MKRGLLTLLCAATLTCQAGEFGKLMRFPTGHSAAYETSLIALLGNPKEWNGRDVSVMGFIAPDVHGTLLYISSELCLAGAEHYSVQVDLEPIKPEIDFEDLPKLRCELVTVQGRFIEQPREAPRPDLVVIRDRPGLIEAQYVGYQ